ncbi:MAG: hypothetical protein ABIG42_01595 [bacterium]
MRSEYPLKRDCGFTVVELTISAIILSVLLIVLCGCTSSILQTYHDELKNNLKTIQAALERYSVDHDGSYPEYLIGGDLAGWDTKTGCESISARPPFALNIKQTNLEGGGSRPPQDPLIEGGYLTSYPSNPFLKDKIEEAPAFSGGLNGQPGTGDVRFGLSGTIMGNALDDPYFLWGRYPVFAQPDNVRVQPARLINTMSQAAWNRGFGVIHHRNEINPFYSTGGIPDPKNKTLTIRRWWPGQFFYRASGNMRIRDDIEPENLEKAEQLTIWDFVVEKYDRYMLGAYADRSTTGLDLVRLTTIEGETIQNRSGIIHGSYRRSSSADYAEDKSIYLSPPEVFGGGGKGVAPFFPYFDETGEFIYGAPDGHPDGILDFVCIDGNRILNVD